MKRVVLLQTNYLPWRGYFDLMAKCDVFITYDSRQYTTNDWRNRNRVKMADGPRWFTIPVLTKGRTGQRIVDAEVSDDRWLRSHPSMLQTALGRAPFGPAALAMLRDAYDEAAATRSLHRINLVFLTAVHRELGLTCEIAHDHDYGVDELESLSPSERVAELVERAGGDRYLTGPSGLGYLEREHFESRGIVLEVLDYATLDPYPQLYGDFVEGMSVVDLLANTGPDARRFLSSTVVGAGLPA